MRTLMECLVVDKEEQKEMLEFLEKCLEEGMIEQFNGDMTKEDSLDIIHEDVDQEQVSNFYLIPQMM